MGINIINIINVQPSTAQGHLHTPRGTLAIRVGSGEVVGISRVAITDDLTINFCPTHDGMIHLLQHQHSGSLSHHKTITILVERAGGMLGVIIARAHRLHRRKPTHCHGHHGRLGSAGKDRLGVSHLDCPPCFTQCVRTGGTSTTGGDVGPT